MCCPLNRFLSYLFRFCKLGDRILRSEGIEVCSKDQNVTGSLYNAFCFVHRNKTDFNDTTVICDPYFSDEANKAVEVVGIKGMMSNTFSGIIFLMISQHISEFRIQFHIVHSLICRLCSQCEQV